MAKNNAAKKINSTSNATPKEAPAAHRPGVFAWHEIRTKDVAKTARIFGEVVGWTISSMPMPPEAGGGAYTLASTKSGAIAGIVPLEDGQRPQLIGYLSVDDVDAALARVIKAGGKALGAPFDVPTIGRMVEVQEPDGAAFFLFKSAHGDAELAPAAGAVIWNELWAKDEKKALAFLTSVVGYVVEAMPMGDTTYHVLAAKSGKAGGVMASPLPGLPAHFLQYLQVDDVEAALARARKHGCSVEGDVQEVPGVGRFAFVRTDEGVRFGVMTPAA